MDDSSSSNVEELLEDLSVKGKGGSGVVPLADPPLRVASFNIRIMGVKKIKQKDVTHILLQIISRYDLVLIQEVRDRSQTAIDRLVEQLNTGALPTVKLKAPPVSGTTGAVKRAARLESDDPFACQESERLGRTNSKEQYVFLYRPRLLQVVDTYQYDDGVDDGTDVFQREPFAVRFTSPNTEVKDFGVIAIHTDPDDAVREIGALNRVYDVTKQHWNLEDILIAGDLNADEGYVNQDDWSKIKLRTDRRFKWLIDDETDTTVGNTDRAYDRFVAVGKKLNKGIIAGSAQCYRFDEDLKLSKDDAEQVSDHYPIELQLYGQVNREVQRHTSSDVSVVIHQTRPLDSVNDARRIYRTEDQREAAGFQMLVLKENSSMHEVRATRPGVQDVVTSLREFQAAFPDVITDDTLSLVAAYMTSSVMTSCPVVYGLIQEEASSTFDVTVTASLQEPYVCRVIVTKRIS